MSQKEEEKNCQKNNHCFFHSYKCTSMATTRRDKPTISSPSFSVPKDTKLLFKGVPVVQFALVVDCATGREMYVPSAHLRDCTGGMAAVPCPARQ